MYVFIRGGSVLEHAKNFNINLVYDESLREGR